MAQQKIYQIPDNFIDDEKIFGGKFRMRNFIEAVCFAVPVVGFFFLVNWATGIGWDTLFYPTAVFTIMVFILGVIGYNGDSWGETLTLAQKFRANKYNISTYNPRIKTELTADYLSNPNANAHAEAIRNFIKNLNEVLAGARGQSEISDDLTSDKTVLYYLEDEGIVEKPEQLKTAAEIKQEAKDAKKAAKELKRKQREYLSTLGPKERKIMKAKYKAEAMEKEEKDRQRREAELKRYQDAVAAREAKEVEKAKEKAELKKLEEERKAQEAKSNKETNASHRAELRRLRKENAAKEKTEELAKKQQAKDETAAKKREAAEAKKKKAAEGRKKKDNSSKGVSPAIEKEENKAVQPNKATNSSIPLVSFDKHDQAEKQPSGVEAGTAKKSEISAIDNLLNKQKGQQKPIKQKVEAVQMQDKTRQTSVLAEHDKTEDAKKAEENVKIPIRPKAPIKKVESQNITDNDSEKERISEPQLREVPDLLGGHNAMFGIGDNSAGGFVLNNKREGE